MLLLLLLQVMSMSGFSQWIRAYHLHELLPYEHLARLFKEVRRPTTEHPLVLPQIPAAVSGEPRAPPHSLIYPHLMA